MDEAVLAGSHAQAVSNSAVRRIMARDGELAARVFDFTLCLGGEESARPAELHGSQLFANAKACRQFVDGRRQRRDCMILVKASSRGQSNSAANAFSTAQGDAPSHLPTAAKGNASER